MPRVSQAVVRAELDAVETLIARHPDGIGRARLEQVFAESQGRRIAKRTLLRRLKRLAAEDRIRLAGDGPQTVYRPGPGLVLEAPAPEQGYVPLSRDGARVRALVRRPMMEREPVGYNPDFVESYQPGSTWYLPAPVRQRLHERGRTPDRQRPAGTYAREIFGRLLIDLAWASSRLEGNTYSRLDTQNLLEFGQRAQGKDVTEAQMILNHKAAIELLVEDIDRLGFDLPTFQSLHAALSENLLGDPADEGRLRRRIVDLSGSVYRPLSIPQQIEEHCRILLDKADRIPDPFEQSFFVMVHLPYLQPFTGVNKRTSRLGANLPLVKANLSPLSFVDVPRPAYVEGTLGVYELNRVELLRDTFVWAYERSCAQYRVALDSLAAPDPVRLRYRSELADLVRDTVQTGAPPNTQSIRHWALARGVAGADVDAFADIALSLLLGLHEGALHRYRIRPAEFREWKARFAPR
jgi:hypothetical protein